MSTPTTPFAEAPNAIANSVKKPSSPLARKGISVVAAGKRKSGPGTPSSLLSTRADKSNSLGRICEVSAWCVSYSVSSNQWCFEFAGEGAAAARGGDHHYRLLSDKDDVDTKRGYVVT